MRRALAVVALLLAVGCSKDQDPGIVPSGSGGTSTTSHPLQACPPGGPDATTPAEGCLDADGKVVHPG